VTPEVLARLCQRAVRLAPGLAGAQVSASWAGFRPTPADGLPVLGQSELRGLHVATGHHRNGILLAPVTAQIVAALVTGERSPLPLEAFSPAR
jgi:glycine oxidase